jgi:hypothetical protein
MKKPKKDNTLQPWQESLLEQLKLIRKGELTNVTHH